VGVPTQSVMTVYGSVIVTNHTSHVKGPGFDLQVKCLSKQDFYDTNFRFLWGVLFE
jgi:hypothetical protein